jgi:hypothetical protein
VSLVCCSFLLSCGTEWLTGTRTCPDRSIFGPFSESERQGPSTNPGEEMTLCVPFEVVWLHVLDASFVNISPWYQSGFNRVS